MNATDDETIPPPPPPPPPGPGSARRLTRSTDDKVLTGLCGGLGRYFGIDPLIFRVAFVVLALAGGTGILLYLVGWLLIPDDHGGVAIGERMGKERTRQLVLAVLAGAGILLLVNGFHHDRGPDFPVALVLVAVGAAILWSRRDRWNAPPAPPAGRATGPDRGPATPPLAASPAEVTGTGVIPPPPASPTLGPVPPRPASPPRPRSVLVSVTLSILAVLGGTLALLQVPLAVSLAIALLVTGCALVVGAWRGRARWLIPIAILLGASVAVASVVDVPLTGGTGDRTYRPTTLAQLRPTYRMAAGQLVLDLSALDLGGRTANVLVTDGIGHIRVIVPPSAQVVAIGHAGAGEVRLFDSVWDGTHVDRRSTATGHEGGGVIVVRARVGVGQVEVLHAAA